MIKTLHVFAIVSAAIVLLSVIVFIKRLEASGEGELRTNIDLKPTLSADQKEAFDDFRTKIDRYADLPAEQEESTFFPKQAFDDFRAEIDPYADLPAEQKEAFEDFRAEIDPYSDLPPEQKEAFDDFRAEIDRYEALPTEEEVLYNLGHQSALESQRNLHEARSWKSSNPAADQKGQVQLIIESLRQLEAAPLTDMSLAAPSFATEDALSELLRHTERLFFAKLAIPIEELSPVLKAFDRFTESRLGDLEVMTADGVHAVVATLRMWSADLEAFGDSFAKFEASDSSDRLTNILALLRSLDKHKQRNVALLMAQNVYTINVNVLKLFVQLLGLHQEVRAILLRESMAAQIRMYPEWSRDQCAWRFEKYIPSAWEQEWQLNMESGLWQDFECEMLKYMGKYSIGLVRRNQELMLTPGFPKNPVAHDPAIDHIYSHMVYVEECGVVVNKRVHQLIEPLVGINRDPLTFCTLLPEVKAMAGRLKYDTCEDGIQSKRFVLAQPAAPWAEVPLPGAGAGADIGAPAHTDSDVGVPDSAWRLGGMQPWGAKSRCGRSVLVDMGASTYAAWGSAITTCGASWFVDRWRRFNISFDSIISFEYQKHDPDAVYAAVPKDILPHYIYYNQGVDADPEGKFNVWRILRAISRQDDYIVVKLDIDNPAIENALFDQFRSDPALVDLVDEFFYEHHVDNKAMRSSWGRIPNLRMRDTYTNFRQLRMRGVRQHSWP